MNPQFDPERYQRLRDEARARALELRRRAINEAIDRMLSAFRRLGSRKPAAKPAAA